jgi:organic hydroperoxide reductase OsmC/OhrA
MSAHKANISWVNHNPDFSYDTYDRTHTWSFEGGINIKASSAPLYFGNAAFVDPEEALVASLSSCHMLTFLAIAAKKRLHVLSYEDEAEGYLEKNERGKLAVTRVVLRPKVVFKEGVEVEKEVLDRLHHRAHEECFIANSVLTEITVEAVLQELDI